MGKGSGVVWECQNCGSQFPKWTGQCPECQKWNSLVETVVSTKLKASGRAGSRSAGQISKPRTLSEILNLQVNIAQRIETGIAELDRVLGGGLVPGEVVLLAGEPGMGKSTLLSRVALAMTAGYQSSVVGYQSTVSRLSVNQSETDKPKTGPAKQDLAPRDKPGTENRPARQSLALQAPAGGKQRTDNRTVLYVCGEESPSQVGLRLQRLLQSQTHPERAERVEGSRVKKQTDFAEGTKWFKVEP